MKTTKKIFIIISFIFSLSLLMSPFLVSAAEVCSGGTCSYVKCYSNSECGSNRYFGFQTCQGNSIYQNYRTYTCNNPGTANAFCTSSSVPKFQITCGQNQQCTYGKCTEALQQPSLPNNNPAPTTPQSSCTSYVSKKCVGNSVYWQDSCGNQGSLYQNCTTTNKVCSAAKCVDKQAQNPPPAYIKNYRTMCHNNSVYWFNSLGTPEDIYENCSDDNQCTIDSCGDNVCSRALKCDGSTCAKNSPDYIKHCGGGEKIKSEDINVFISGKKEVAGEPWSETVNVQDNEKVNFLLTIKNVSSLPLENVSIKLGASDNIVYTENIKIDNVDSVGNIVSGINLGTMASNTFKDIYITSSIKAGDAQSEVKLNATVSNDTIYNSDFLTIVIAPKVAEAQADSEQNFTAAVSENSSSFIGTLMNFMKRWYIWLLVSVILLLLFIVLFRRLSSEV